MKISTKGRYALRMMIDLAAHGEGEFVALKDIAERQDISKKYLEQIVPLLGKAELLRANRGNRGGYALTRPPEKYTVGEILRVTEGNMSPVACLQYKVNTCPRRAECTALPVWEGLNKVIADYLDGITLRDILDGKDNDRCI